MRSDRGQILPLALVLILLVAFLWVMLLNVGKLIKDRIQMQIAADTAVQSACAYRARALNIAGFLNGWLGTPVIGIGTPLASWWAAPPHPMGAGVTKQTYNDFKKTLAEAQTYMTEGQKADTQSILQGVLRGLMSVISLSYDTHPDESPNYAQKQKDFIESVVQVQEYYVKSYGGGWAKKKAREVARAQGADDIFVPLRSFSLGLNRNRGQVWYLSTIHVWIAYYPWVPIITAPFTPINADDDITKRWYEQSPHFYQKSMRLYAFRRPTSAWNNGWPFGKNVLNVDMPYLYTVAAARVYNPDGPMFPSQGETDGFLGGMAAMRDYNRASKGWHSQLVPVGGSYEH